MTIEEIFDGSRTESGIIAALKEKNNCVPAWGGARGLVREYESKYHPVMDKCLYPDVVTKNNIEKVTRIALNLQKLATKRMTELVCGIPVKRIYHPENDRQAEVARYLERLFEKTRINTVNNERINMLFAGCEVMTLWYAVREKNNLYGFTSDLKMRCRNFTPMHGDEIFPLFDEYGDLIALSVGYKRKTGKRTIQFFDTYTADRHIKWQTGKAGWERTEDESITLGKIPAIYMWRPTPVWENTSETVYEMEWALSRNGNYLRRNSKPLFVVFADQQIRYGDEGSENKEFRAVMQYPQGSTAQYVTWQQAVESLKFHVQELRQWYFTQLQLPDWSYEKMSQQALSGESRKQLFIDAQLKVQDESGRIIEFLDREVNVLKTFLKVALGEAYHADIDALSIENEIKPFSITDEHDTITNLMNANGGKPIISQREAIEVLGWSSDPEQTLKEIQDESAQDLLGGESYQ